MSRPTTLSRALTLPQMVLYGLGTTIGAGIYALVGELAAISGYLAPLSFFVASLMAGLTAISFAELSGRYPRCAGASLYVREGFSSIRLSTVVGILVVAAGIVSSSALVNAFVGYLHQFIVLDRLTALVIVTCLLGSIAAWGIAESVTIAALVTLVEIGGLLMVIIVCLSGLDKPVISLNALLPAMDSRSAGSIFAGCLLAFYAFIGFEDMVEMAEEAKQARRNLPLAILLTLGITTLLYMAIMVSAVLTVPLEDIAGSGAPLALLYEYHTGGNAIIIGVIGLFAIINGVLIQIIMVSRVIYGLSSRGQLPHILCFVHPYTRTPLIATLLVTIAILALASLGSLASLAEATSVIMLCVFSLVNLALIRIKLRTPAPSGVITFHLWIPIAGFMVSTGFVFSSMLMYFQ